MIWVAVLVRMVPALPPNVTDVAPFNAVPVIVTVVPPAIGPVAGLMLTMLGGGT